MAIEITRNSLINKIIDNNICLLADIEEPNLNHTKQLTEILKSILILEQIKKLDGDKSKFDFLNEDELNDKINEAFE